MDRRRTRIFLKSFHNRASMLPGFFFRYDCQREKKVWQFPPITCLDMQELRHHLFGPRELRLQETKIFKVQGVPTQETLETLRNNDVCCALPQLFKHFEELAC